MPDWSELDDAQLVQAARTGDADAYKALVTRYQGHVYGLAYSLVRDWSEAQDIAQETFIRVHGNLDQLRDPARFASWLRRVTFSVAMNWLRAFRPPLFARLDGHVDLDRLEIPDFEPDPGEHAERRELADAVMEAVDSLPPKYRVPLTMFHLDGLSYEKVARFLDIPLGTAKSLIHRARRKLQPALAAYLDEEFTPVMQEVFDAHRLPDGFASRVIHGMEHARWGAGVHENSFIGALHAALQALGKDVSYEFLMGISGAAFRIQMMRPVWCPSAPHPRCGFDCLGAAMAALEYELVDLPASPEDAESVRRVQQAVVDSIDRGVPAFFTSLEESLVVGYQDEGRRLMLRLYGAATDGYAPWCLDREASGESFHYPDSFVGDWPHLSIGVLRERGSVRDRRESVVRSLEIAVELAEAPAFGAYASGFAAYEEWISGLREAARFAEPEARDQAMQANAHCYQSLVDARRAARVYLEEVPFDLDAGARDHLRAAADFYRRIDEILARRPASEIAPTAWSAGDLGWPQSSRDRQAQLLTEVLSLERRAVAELAAARAAC